MHSEYPTKTARIGAILSLMATLVWVQWPIDITQISIAPILFFLAALVVWISVELADWQNHRGYNVNTLNEDARKLNQLINVVDRKTYYILRNASVETYIGSDDYRGLEDLLAYYREDVFPFHNEKLQEPYEKFHKRSANFIEKLWTLYTSDGSGRATWRSHPDRWVDDDLYEEIMAKIAVLNREAAELSDAWENFIRVAKAELRGNSFGIASYHDDLLDE